MRHLALASASVALVLVACTADRSTAPAAAEGPQFSFSGSGIEGCSVRDAERAADGFFKSKKDPVHGILDDLSIAAREGDRASATHLGFDAMREIAEARGTARQKGAGVEGDALVKALASCMSVGMLPDGFSVAAAIDHGVFEVRGGVDDSQLPALAFGAAPSTRVMPATVWGAEASGGWSATYAGNTARYLVYAAPRAVHSFTEENASTDPSDVAYTGFDISTLPSTPGLAFDAPLRVGLCIDAQSDGASNRMLHGGGGDAIIALSPLTFCDAAGSLASAMRESGHLAFARRVLSLLAPREAHAYFAGGVGGLASALSPFGPVQVRMSQAGVTFLQQPTPAGVFQPATVIAGRQFPVRLRVTTALGTPVEGVQVSISADRNSGIPAGAVLQGTTTGLTNERGEVDFLVSIPKPGGYRVAAVAVLGGVPAPPVFTQNFTVNF